MIETWTLIIIMSSGVVTIPGYISEANCKAAQEAYERQRVGVILRPAGTSYCIPVNAVGPDKAT